MMLQLTLYLSNGRKILPYKMPILTLTCLRCVRLAMPIADHESAAVTSNCQVDMQISLLRYMMH